MNSRPVLAAHLNQCATFGTSSVLSASRAADQADIKAKKPGLACDCCDEPGSANLIRQ
jgi:hypothetical protein